MITIKNRNNNLTAYVKIERELFKGLDDSTEVVKFISIRMCNNEIGRYLSKCYNFVLTEMEDIKHTSSITPDWPEDLDNQLKQLTQLILWKIEDEERMYNTGNHNSYFLDLEESMEEEGWVVED